MKRVDKYTEAKLTEIVYFPEGKEICRYCPFCISDPSNHKREMCLITSTILPYADVSIEGNCPLCFDIIETTERKAQQ